MTFWHNLKKPILVLAPMANVTDASFRRVIAKYGKPDVMWTEFVSADGLARAPKEGREKLLRDLVYDESERPIVAQFFSSKPEYMYAAGRLAVKLGFDGADINMGCPDKAVMKQGAGASLIRNPALARELIAALRKGAEDEAREKNVAMIGISVKTRVGYNKVELETWIPELLKEKPDALIVHARTMKEMSKVPARWEHIKEIVTMRDEIQKDEKVKTLILGNGDLKSVEDAREKVLSSNADGAMLGRAIFGNPFLFASLQQGPALIKNIKAGPCEILDVKKQLQVLLEHITLFEELLGDIKNFALMKKHFKSYLNNFPGAKELRIKLMEVENAREAKGIIEEYLVLIG